MDRWRVFSWGAVESVDLLDNISAGAGTFQYLIVSLHRTFQLSNNGWRVAIDPDMD